MIRSAVMALCAGLCAIPSAACSAAEPAPAAAPAQPSQAEQIAALLASLEAAEAAGDKGGMTAALARLDALGAQPAPGSADDPLPRWRAAAASEGAIPFRGRALGPAYRRGTLAADSALELTQTFLSGKKAMIAVSSPGGAAPSLRVVSASGNTVCDSAASCRWTPVFTERYAITLRNPSRTARAYYLVVE